MSRKKKSVMRGRIGLTWHYCPLAKMNNEKEIVFMNSVSYTMEE